MCVNHKTKLNKQQLSESIPYVFEGGNFLRVDNHRNSRSNTAPDAAQNLTLAWPIRNVETADG